MTKVSDENSALTEAHVWRQVLLDQHVSESQRQAFEQWYDSCEANQNAYREACTFCDALPNVKQAIAPDLLKPTPTEGISDVIEQIKSAFFNKTSYFSVSTAAALLVAFFIFFSSPSPDPVSTVVQQQVFYSGVGEIVAVDLKDGTKVTLSPDSGIEASYYSDKRIVKLTRGGAFFDVRSDPDRPFSVEASFLIVTATGTAFDVVQNGGIYRSHVAEGSVKVQYPYFVGNRPSGYNFTESLEEGQGVKVSLDRQLIRLEKVDTGTIASWRDQKLIYNGNSLREIVAELNRYSEVPIEISSEINADELKVRGGFSTHDIFEILDTIANIYDLHISRQAEGKIVLVQKV